MAKWIKPSTPRNVKFAKGVNKKINDLFGDVKSTDGWKCCGVSDFILKNI